MSQTDDRALHEWSARKLQPIILVYVAGVFIAMMAVAQFAVHSPAAVKALALAAIGSFVALLPGVAGKVEYRLTRAGLEQRPLGRNAPSANRTGAGRTENVPRWFGARWLDAAGFPSPVRDKAPESGRMEWVGNWAPGPSPTIAPRVLAPLSVQMEASGLGWPG